MKQINTLLFVFIAIAIAVAFYAATLQANRDAQTSGTSIYNNTDNALTATNKIFPNSFKPLALATLFIIVITLLLSAFYMIQRTAGIKSVGI